MTAVTENTLSSISAGLKLSTQWTGENPKCYVWSWIQPNLLWTSSRNEVTGSNRPVGLHAGTTSSPLHTQRAHNSPLETTPTQGWPVAFGGVSEGARWMPASHSEVRVVEPLTSTPQPSNSWRGRMSRPCLSLPSFRLHFSFIFISGHLENLIAVISILSRLIGIGERKAFFFLSPWFFPQNKINNYNNKNNKIRSILIRKI